MYPAVNNAMTQYDPRKPEPPVTRTRGSEGVDMNGCELKNGLVLATCEYWESMSRLTAVGYKGSEKAAGWSGSGKSG